MSAVERPAPEPEDDDSVDTPLPSESRAPRPSATLSMDDWQARVELRLSEQKRELRSLRRQVEDLAADARMNHAAVIDALEGRTRLAHSIVDGIRSCAEGTGAILKTLLDRVTQPTPTFVAMWVLTLVAVGGITVSEVMDLGGYVSTWWVEAPGPVPSPAQSGEDGTE